MRKLNFIPDQDNYLSARNIGLENNNPGNIRNIGNFKFQGESEPIDGFRSFISMPYGYRALIKNLQAYINQGTNTIEKIVYKWAPASDGFNKPDQYTKHVSERTGINKNKIINAADLNTLGALAAAMSISEIGSADLQAIEAAKQLLNTGAQYTAPPQVQTLNPAVKNSLLIGAALLLGYIFYTKWQK